MPGWEWSESAKRYRDSTTGRFLSKREALGYVDQSIAATGNVTDALSGFVAGETPQIAPGDWERAMRQEIKDEYIRQYLMGRGGRDQMTPVDWGSIGGMLKEQYGYLSGFAALVEAGELSEAQVRARARMYIASAREGYERGAARAQGVPDGVLPAYPGDGSTQCLVNCRCNWRIEPILDEDGQLIGWACYWELSSAEHCDDCLDRASDWYPYEVLL